MLVQLLAIAQIPSLISSKFPRKRDLSWIDNSVAQILEGCKRNGVADDVVLFTPDATGQYAGQWTRDLYYIVSGAQDLMEPRQVLEAVRYTFSKQRADGCMPDRVQTDGIVVTSPGPLGGALADHAMDNGPFAALLLTVTAEIFDDATLFCELETQARRALDFVSRAPNGLVFNDIESPNCSYGFTDTIKKSGHLLFESLLYAESSWRMAKLCTNFGCGDAGRYRAEADKIAESIDVLKDLRSPLWLASSGDNALPDVWGTAYLVALNLSTSEQQDAAMLKMVSHSDLFFHSGQVRHLPVPYHWTKCFGNCAAKNTYQNGAYWATPLPYVVKALLATGHRAFAASLVEECIDSFKEYGINEAIGFRADEEKPFYTGVQWYTVSATSLRQAMKLLTQQRKRDEL